MARLNVARAGAHGTTHEGAPAAAMTPMQALRRSVLACLLWEDQFYESGEEIATRIRRLVGEIAPFQTGHVTMLAVEAREQAKLRHVPLLLLAALAQRVSGHGLSSVRSDTRLVMPAPDNLAAAIARVIQRSDELSEFLAIHAKLNGVEPSKIKKTLSAQVKKGLARAFSRFDEYQLSKYDREGAIKLRDVLFLVHAKPKDEAQAELWKRLVAGELKAPDTWEVALSGGADKRETFERLIRERKLGYLALLRNLRNMQEAGVNPALVRDAIVARKGGAERVLPFRYVAAARAAPQFEPAIDQALCETISEMPILPGKTIVLADVSSSMDAKLSGKSDMTRVDAACVLASIIHGDVRMFSFSDSLVEVPPRRGMAGVDALRASQPHSGTQLIAAVREISDRFDYDRLIVITDEQSHPMQIGRQLGLPDPKPGARGYMINVASYQRGVGYGRWTHIDGFSENVLRYINEVERAE
jgi:60 kDa SS-A/Ro ribonucleoprotein